MYKLWIHVGWNTAKVLPASAPGPLGYECAGEHATAAAADAAYLAWYGPPVWLVIVDDGRRTARISHRAGADLSGNWRGSELWPERLHSEHDSRAAAEAAMDAWLCEETR